MYVSYIYFGNLHISRGPGVADMKFACIRLDSLEYEPLNNFTFWASPVKPGKDKSLPI